MMMRLRLSSLSLLMLALPAGLLAQASGGGPRLGIGVGAGTFGISTEAKLGLANRFETRVQLNYFKLSRTDQSIGNVAYGVDARWLSGALLGDLYLAGPIRITAGALWNGNRLTIDANPTVNVTIGDTTYQATDIGTINGKIDFRRVSPYLGVGFAGRGRVSPVLQLGVLLQGSPQVTYDATTTLTGAAKTRFDQEVQQEVAQIEDDLSFFKYYPHVALGLTIRL